MTKKQEAQEVLDAIDATPVTTTQAQEAKEHDQYLRRHSLDFAIAFHKNNGGMSQPTQVVSTATVFLDFIKGDSK